MEVQKRKPLKTAQNGVKTQTQKSQRDAAKEQIIKTALTWGHVITLSVLGFAAVMNVGGFFAIVFKPDVAEKLTGFAETWQTFYIAGILGYDAKSAVENVLKISKSVKELKETTESTEESTTTNG